MAVVPGFEPTSAIPVTAAAAVSRVTPRFVRHPHAVLLDCDPPRRHTDGLEDESHSRFVPLEYCLSSCLAPAKKRALPVFYRALCRMMQAHARLVASQCLHTVSHASREVPPILMFTKDCITNTPRASLPLAASCVRMPVRLGHSTMAPFLLSFRRTCNC